MSGVSLDDLGDVDLAGLADNDIIQWDTGTSKWKCETLPAGVTDHGALTGLGDDDHSRYRYWTNGYTFFAGATGSAQFTNQTGTTQTIIYVSPSAFQVQKKTTNYQFQARFTNVHSPGTATLYHSDDNGSTWTSCDSEFMAQNAWQTFTCTHKFTSDERADDLKFKMVWPFSCDQQYQSFVHATIYTGYKVETGTE